MINKNTIFGPLKTSFLLKCLQKGVNFVQKCLQKGVNFTKKWVQKGVKNVIMALVKEQKTNEKKDIPRFN